MHLIVSLNIYEQHTNKNWKDGLFQIKFKIFSKNQKNPNKIENLQFRDNVVQLNSATKMAAKNFVNIGMTHKIKIVSTKKCNM